LQSKDLNISSVVEFLALGEENGCDYSENQLSVAHNLIKGFT